MRMILPAAGYEVQAESVYRKHETLFQPWVMYGKSSGKSIINALWVEIRMANYVEIPAEEPAEGLRLEAGRLKASQWNRVRPGGIAVL